MLEFNSRNQHANGVRHAFLTYHMGAILILCVMHLEGIHICTRILSDGGSLTHETDVYFILDAGCSRISSPSVMFMRDVNVACFR